ncbi:flagellar basal body L-ring protein FlgH [Helicobacter sp. MIT 99-5507]|uniref:flagellar basal body L-ring protein FlgH n=1 Tax=Helicobacter sp. MIT 99-5507 TaxID=152489 RepID=UPI000E1E8FFC|nr:flagellar basal body L-ring protein FlgH [Helicobacter sp. MIT 99-5507]RDU57861.1 flagellar basal body L-ring protein [Helicobacter sp. MIT 99-5507]
MVVKKQILLLLILLVYSLYADPIMDFSPPRYVEELGEKDFIEEFPKLGSLFGQGERPMFADRRAMRVNDILLVKVNESSNATFSTQKTYNGTQGGELNAPIVNYTGNNAEIAQNIQDFKDGSSFNMTLGAGNSNFNSGGSQNRDENVNLEITARVIKVLSNGNYYIEGTRQIMIDGEKKVILISGVIRPYDISSDNSIESKFISELKLNYTSEGDISNKRHQKWGSKELEQAWPY